MLVPEQLGHTFGMAVAEFSVSNKPCIVYNGDDVWNTAHIDILARRGQYFKNYDDLMYILMHWKKPSQVNDWNAYAVNDRYVIEI